MPEIDYKDLFNKVIEKQNKLKEAMNKKKDIEKDINKKKDLEKDLKSGLPEEKVRTNDVSDENWASAAPKRERVWTLEEERLRVEEQNAQFYESAPDPFAKFRQKYHSGNKDWTLKDPDMKQYNRENDTDDAVDNKRGIP